MLRPFYGMHLNESLPQNLAIKHNIPSFIKRLFDNKLLRIHLINLLDYTSNVYVENTFQYSSDLQKMEFVCALLCPGNALTSLLAG